jgi:hypothetical protein
MFLAPNCVKDISNETVIMGQLSTGHLPFHTVHSISAHCPVSLTIRENILITTNIDIDIDILTETNGEGVCFECHLCVCSPASYALLSRLDSSNGFVDF